MKPPKVWHQCALFDRTDHEALRSSFCMVSGTGVYHGIPWQTTIYGHFGRDDEKYDKP